MSFLPHQFEPTSTIKAPGGIDSERLFGMSLSVQNISKSMAGKVVLNDVSFDLSAGEVLVIIGPSGAGKSTLLRCINLLQLIDAGAIHLDGKPTIIAQPFDDRSNRRRRTMRKLLFDDAKSNMNSDRVVHVKPDQLRRVVGMVFQEFNLWDDRTVLANLCEAPIQVLNAPRVEIREQAMFLLHRFNLDALSTRLPRELSGGQKQRVAIIRALMMRPRLLLLDEITSALDVEATVEVLDMLRSLVRCGLTTILVTHHLSFARDVATRIAFMDKGRIIEIGGTSQVLEQPAQDRTRRYLQLVRYSR